MIITIITIITTIIITIIITITITITIIIKVMITIMIMMIMIMIKIMIIMIIIIIVILHHLETTPVCPVSHEKGINDMPLPGHCLTNLDMSDYLIIKIVFTIIIIRYALYAEKETNFIYQKIPVF